MIKRFSEYNRADFDEIIMIGVQNFNELCNFIIAACGITVNPIKKNIENSEFIHYIQSINNNEKIKGLEILHKKYLSPDFCIFLIFVILKVKQCLYEIRPEFTEKTKEINAIIRSINLIDLLFSNSKNPTSEFILKSFPFIRILILSGNIPPDFPDILYALFSSIFRLFYK